MIKLYDRVFLSLLFVWVPLAFFARAADGFTLTKEAVACLALAYFAARILAQGLGLLKVPLVRWALLFMAWMIADSLFVGPLKMEVLKGSIHILLMGGTLLAVLFACSKGVSYEKQIQFALLTASILALFGITQHFGLDPLTWNTKFEQRAFATLGNPDYLGGYLAALLPLIFILTLRSKYRERWLLLRAGTLAIFMGLVLTWARGAFLALGLAVLFMAITFFFPWGKDLFKRNVIFVVVCLAILVIGAGTYMSRHGGWEVFSASQVSVQQRIQTYRVAWEMVKEHPLLGIGLGQLGVLYPLYQSRPYTKAEYPQHPYTYTEHIHNEFLQFWVEGGLPGLILFLGLLAAFALAVRKFISNPESRKEDKELMIGVTGGVVALLGQSLSNFPLQVAPTAVLFGLFLAGPLVLKKSQDQKVAQVFNQTQTAVLVFAIGVTGLIAIHTVGASIAYRDAVGETSLGKGQNAEYYANRASVLSPYNPKVWNACGAALNLADKKDFALQAYMKALSLNPQYVENYYDMANIRVQQGNFQDTLALCQKAESLVPNYIAPLWPEAVSLFQMGRYEESAKAFEDYLVFAPNDFQTFLDLGVCYIKLKRKTDAIAAWKKANAINPGDPTVLQYLKSQGVQIHGI
jgi:O-antigen ligase/Flp pilus assembly protein TadD